MYRLLPHQVQHLWVVIHPSLAQSYQAESLLVELQQMWAMANHVLCNSSALENCVIPVFSFIHFSLILYCLRIWRWALKSRISAHFGYLFPIFHPCALVWNLFTKVKYENELTAGLNNFFFLFVNAVILQTSVAYFRAVMLVCKDRSDVYFPE